MAHELSILNDGTVEMAYLTNEGPCWHGLGTAVPLQHPVESWLQASNMGNWKIKEAATLFYDEDTDDVYPYNDRKVLYRSDNRAPLSVVGANYKAVQPDEIVTFFQDIIDSLGFEMSTCGVLFGGKRFWAQANIGQSVNLMGVDRVDGKLLLSTSCDGSLATTASYTTVRTVCNNTLQLALKDKQNAIKTSHSSVFDSEKVKVDLGLKGDEMQEWGYIAEQMTKVRLTSAQSMDFFGKVFDLYEEEMDKEERLQISSDNKQTMTCYELFNSRGLGSELVTAKGTLFGAVNAVTQYCDWERNTRTIAAKLNSAWFGQHNTIKNNAWDEAIMMI